jgi:3-phenylpropionate/cinnamic acid dioxygenase small subunit
MVTAEPAQLSAEFKLDVQEFYFRYAECLDGGRLNNWPEFFVDGCVYRIGTRKALRGDGEDDFMNLTGRSAMRDRVVAIGQSEDYEPHQQRHFLTNFRIQNAADEELRVQVNFQVLRTFPERPTEPFLSGYYLDRVAVNGRRLNFREKLCVLDSDVSPGSLVYPI